MSTVLIARRVDVSNSANLNRHSSASSTPVNNNEANKRAISDTDETFGIKKKITNGDNTKENHSDDDELTFSQDELDRISQAEN